MAPTTKSPRAQVSFFDDEWQSHLESELSLGRTLLRRHKSSHGRTRYFRRVDLAFRALEQSDTLQVYASLREWQESDSSQKNKTKTSDQFWSLKKDRTQETRKNNLTRWALETSPELQSRLEASVELIVGELSRSFFVSWNVTALALVARLWKCVGTLQTQICSSLGLRLDSTQNRIKAGANHTTIDRAETILKSLGVMDISSKAVHEKRKDNSRTSDRSVNDLVGKQESKQSADATSSKIDNAPTPNLMDLSPDNDVGETMDQVMKLQEEEKAKGEGKQSAKRKAPVVDNETRVQEWQEEQSRRKMNKSKSKKNKSKESNTSPSPSKRPREKEASSTSVDPPKAKKKKKKKKQKGDFFDSLFD